MSHYLGVIQEMFDFHLWWSCFYEIMGVIGWVSFYSGVIQEMFDFPYLVVLFLRNNRGYGERVSLYLGVIQEMFILQDFCLWWSCFYEITGVIGMGVSLFGSYSKIVCFARLLSLVMLFL